MAPVTHSAIINSAARDVWHVLREFGAIALWHPAITHSELEGDLTQPAIGVIRRLQLADNALLRERLLTLDDGVMSLSYCFEQSPLPVDNYRASIQVSAVSGQSACHVHWQAHFDVRDPALSDTLQASIHALIVSGHDSLASYLRGLSALPRGTGHIGQTPPIKS
jgi:hypothetical protein